MNSEPAYAALPFVRYRHGAAKIHTIVYIHFSLQGHSLYIEFSTFVLPPTMEKYYVFDEAGKLGLKYVATSVAGAVWRLPSLVAHLPQNVGRALHFWLMLLGAEEQARSRGLDIGARLSARELGADMHTHDWFQFRDTMKHWEDHRAPTDWLSY